MEGDARQQLSTLMHDIETKLTRLGIHNGKDEGNLHDVDEEQLLKELEGKPGTQE